MPPRVTIYSTSWCVWCRKAKSLLEERGIAYAEVDGEKEWGAAFRDEIEKRTGGRSVPQVVIDGRPIGGYEGLAALALDGGLDHLVERA